MQISVVSRLKHDNFVGLLGYCLDADNRILVYQFSTKGSLHDVLHGTFDRSIKSSPTKILQRLEMGLVLIYSLLLWWQGGRVYRGQSLDRF